MTNLGQKYEELKRYMNNNDYDKAISVINEIRNISERPAELSNASLKSLQVFLYFQKGDLESSFDSKKSAYVDSGGCDNKIKDELVNISISLFDKIFTSFESNQNFNELSKAERYINEIKNLYNKPNELNENLPKIEFTLIFKEFNYYKNNKNFDLALSKINAMKNISSSARPVWFNDANLINKEACILNNDKKDYTNAFKKIKQAL